MIILIFMMNLCFSNRRGLHPSCACSSDSSNPAPGRRFQVSASQIKPVRPTSPRLQHQSCGGRPPCSLWLRQELQRVLRHLSPLRRQHTEWPLQGSSPWVHSILICLHEILTVHFFQHVSVFLKNVVVFFLLIPMVLSHLLYPYIMSALLPSPRCLYCCIPFMNMACTKRPHPHSLCYSLLSLPELHPAFTVYASSRSTTTTTTTVELQICKAYFLQHARTWYKRCCVL